jgi:hypothetical protein
MVTVMITAPTVIKRRTKAQWALVKTKLTRNKAKTAVVPTAAE